MTMYQANDGKLFDKKEDAIHYEKLLNGSIKKAIRCLNCGGSGKINMYGDSGVFVMCTCCWGSGKTFQLFNGSIK